MITLRRLAVAQYKGLQAIDLVLPEKGSFLIEGRNEAGKSTLFDAVYFALYGVPLVGDIASAIHYGAQDLEVRLGLDVGGTSLDVRRHARQTAKAVRSDAKLEVRRGDDTEVVNGSAAVSQRLQQELGGLTSEALLNSCLVAQKQLGRLETLDRSAREQALTILLNLGKLFEVERRVKPSPQGEVALREARTRVALAGATRELRALEERRIALLRAQRLLDLREGIDRLQALQQQIDGARQEALAHEARLNEARQTLAKAAELHAAAGAWRRVADLARAVAEAEGDVAAAQQALADARAAAETLPAVRQRAERYRQARDQVLALGERQARLRELASRADFVAQRLAEREQVAQRAARLDGELDALRKQRLDLSGQIAQIAPLEGKLQETNARIAALQVLTGQLEALETQRRALEDLEASAAERAEADARYEEAAADLAEARASLGEYAQLRAAYQERRRTEGARAALATWIERRQALDAAEQAKRLMDDLALAVAAVEHVALQNAALDLTGLRLRLVLEHPLTGAQLVELELSAAGATLRQARPATKDEARGLTAAGLPTLNAAGEARPQERLAEATRAVAAAGEATPKTVAAAQQRLAALERSLAAPAPAFDEGAYLTAAGAVSAAEARLKDAAAARSGLATGADLAAQSGRARRQALALEAECLAAAQRVGLQATETTAMPAAIQILAAQEQRRATDLAGAMGRRAGLEGQLANVIRSGKERARELEECRANLATDDDAALRAEQAQVAAERSAAATEVLRLYGALRAALGGKDAGAAGLPKTPRAAGELSEVAVAALRTDAQRLADEASGDLAVLEEKGARAERLAEELAEARAEVERAQGELGEAVGAAPSPPGPLSQGGRRGETVGGCDVSAQQAAEVAGERLEALAAELAGLDEVGTRAAEQEAYRAAGAAEAGLQRAMADAAQVARDLTGVTAAIGCEAPDGEMPVDGPAVVAARLLEACPDAAGTLPAREETQARLRQLEQEVGRHEHARRDAVATFGKDEEVDLEAAQAVLAELERDLTARRVAVEMVTATRRRMIDKVLPDTIANMCLLLPQLTAGRYRFANLTGDYRLQVWDERKRDYVEKMLYSGGTQDQFSLALRLGFALAALPRELGTSPGFLFLDEPLSSFDRDRTAALVDLLTHGQIATFFQQVFLISHSQSFDPALFTHHIVMEEGHVAHSTLPAAA